MKITRLDHVVLTVADIEVSLHFYSHYLGMDIVTFAGNRKALSFGQQKINLHQRGKEFNPKAANPSCGSADLCFIIDIPVEQAKLQLQQQGVEIIEGVVERTGAIGKIVSIYLRDPDQNLIELSNYIAA